MASSISPLQLVSPATAQRPTAASPPMSPKPPCIGFSPPNRRSFSRVVSVSAVGDVSADSSIYLFAGAAAVALIGTAFPIFFARKDLCPECDGAGFIRQAGAPLRANAARKDQAQIVCPRCNGLGKLGQIDK
ncbi:uncharacterized protein LOC110028082 [Phalaenopsis equestris]|uniref:uncharacterized protein LOC110028082 n=1 Tax=Phalaenopsis equestris TaxID=78828 RepID=UPI0009E3D722|nr:uncharacterized protein LOC110028082 [Phalaenopsis equestris]